VWAADFLARNAVGLLGTVDFGENLC